MRIYDTIQAVVFQGGDEANFKDTATALKDAKIMRILVRKGGKSKNGKNVISNDNAFNACFLELQDRDSKTVVNIPLQVLFSLSNSGECKGLEVENVLNWDNSKIRSYNSSNLTTGEVVELFVEAEK
jgi:uncharacterized cupredoxin-like copper-binding protein